MVSLKSETRGIPKYGVNFIPSLKDEKTIMFSRTDRLVIAAIFSIYFVFIINTWLASTIMLYIGVLVAGGVFLYCIVKLDPFKLVRNGLIVGVIGGVIYSYIDTLLSDKPFLIITYLRPDIHPYTAAPLSLILIWFLEIAGVVYFYQRMNSFFQKIYIPSLLTGILVFFMSVTLGQLGDLARLWNWNISRIHSPFIGRLPLYVPIGLFLSFLFSEFFVGKNSIIGGIRCGIAIGIGQFISYLGMEIFFI